MKLKRFEDAESWKLARILTSQVYKIRSENTHVRDPRFWDQLTAAAVSIMNNIAEGFDSQSTTEFIGFLRYSRRSCSEVQNCLYVALDQNYVDENRFKIFYDQAARLRQMIDGWIRYLKRFKRIFGNHST